MATLLFALAACGGSDEAGGSSAKKDACDSYEAWKRLAYEETLGMGTGEFEAHLDEEQELKDHTSSAFAKAAKADSEWIPVQEAFKRYVPAMIGYSSILDVSGPEDAAVRSESSATIESACERL
jgi:hypothetical protein